MVNLKQLENIAKRNNWTIRVAKPQITESTWSNISAFAVNISDKKTQLPVSINDDIDLLDIKLKVADDHNYMAESSFYYQESSYQTSSGSKFTLPSFAEKFKFISKHSWFEGHFHEGHRVIATTELTSQKTDLLREANDLELDIKVIKVDITNPLDLEQIEKYDFDVFVANAAINERGPLGEVPMDRFRALFEVNVLQPWKQYR